MQLSHRSLTGTGLLRPQPMIFQTDDKKTIAVISNWGSAALTSMVVERIKSTMSPKAFDSEKTVPKVPLIHRETPIETKLADALRLANDEIFRSENEKAWKTVMEVTLIHADQGVLYWAQAGLPHLLLFTNAGVEFLCVSNDASANFDQPVPLPMFGLGLDLFPNVNSGSVAWEKGQKLALLSLPGRALPLLNQNSFALDDLCGAVANLFPNQPAWIGVAV